MIATGYAAVQRETLTGRALEREVVIRITARLEGADTSAPGGPTALISAGEENRRLWTTLAIDLANPQNQCSDELRAGLISLAAFVQGHSRSVISGTASPQILVEINRNIIKGLSSPDMAAA